MPALRTRVREFCQSCVVVGVLSCVFVCAADLAHAQTPADRAAEVNGAPITGAEVDAKLGGSLAKLQEQIFSLRQQQLDAMIDQKLLEGEAARRGVTIAALVQSEITAKVAPATAGEATTFYAENTPSSKATTRRSRSKSRTS